MNILDRIILDKKAEVEEKKELIPVKMLQKSILFETMPVSMSKYIKRPDKSGVIAEIKRKSPSKGDINPFISVEEISIGYMQAGASALSVLTDKKYFGGTNEDVQIARKFNYCPILRKEFIVDKYQIIEAKSIGADCILLIASVLSPVEIEKFTKLAHDLGMEVLLEVHNEEELKANLDSKADLFGVNNRNLKTFDVDLENSISLLSMIPDEKVKIAESGIHRPEDLVYLKNNGFDGFLIGERFMRYSRPHEEARKFLSKVKEIETYYATKG
ncbi:indole-3-glycerol phosphate synthase TrpC [Marinigracilibium pacificum]|uniref:Indole-3-glycerol phosphate synthase n=1 Tax=Marinigracilibium pacificum TaxID=2729599 RepID=A0A848J569_9BACT|nr:indole-3-glycerol phosphate synthase TrpC [Marinigracilibium pacificum]NMM50625.1 indole-3-glycerol phosphate synthase TrpC [Marinigracilibium pacificum]